MTASWEWPQYLLAFWWGFWLLARVLFRLAGGTVRGKPQAPIYEWWGAMLYQLINITVLAIILYFGGFWS